MEIEVTPEGVEIWHMTRAERIAWYDNEVRRLSDFDTADAFIAAYKRGELNAANVDVDELSILLGVGRSHA